MSERQFFEKLHRLGYEMKPGKDLSVRAFGRERFVRLERSFGGDYSIEGIRRRILEQSLPEIPACPKPQKSFRFNGAFHKARRKTGLRALYFYYLHRLGYFNRNKNRGPSAGQVHFMFREDIRYIRRISEETRMLAKHKIDTDVQLGAHKQELQNRLGALSSHRRILRGRQGSIKDGAALAAAKSEIGGLSKIMGGLRREARMCDEVEARSKNILCKLRAERSNAKNERKEPMKDEQFRRRR